MTAADHREIIALFDGVLALAIQLLIAANPDLLLPPEAAPRPLPRRLRQARELFDLVRELHISLERYRLDAHPDVALTTTGDDDFPF